MKSHFTEKQLRDAFRIIKEDSRWDESKAKGDAFMPLGYDFGLKYCFALSQWSLTWRFDGIEGLTELAREKNKFAKYEDLAEDIDRFFCKMESEEIDLLVQSTNEDQETLTAVRSMMLVLGLLQKDESVLVRDYGELGLDHIKRVKDKLRIS